MQTKVEIEAPQEAVWEIVADPRNMPRWDRHIVAVRGVPDSGLEEGTEYSTELRFMGVRGKLRAKVLELRRPRYAKVKVSGILDAIVETRLEPIDDGRTALAQRVDYRFMGGPLGLFAAGAVRRLGAKGILQRGVLAQKRQAEDGR